MKPREHVQKRPSGFCENGPGPWQELECIECNDYVESTEIVAGALHLPDGWRWIVCGTNVSPGWFLSPLCPDCCESRE
jgi:hypothetical protein